MGTRRLGTARSTCFWVVVVAAGVSVVLADVDIARAQGHIRGSSRYPSSRRQGGLFPDIIIGGDTPPPPAAPVYGTDLVRFAKWTAGTNEAGAAALLMVVSDAKGKNSATLVCPNRLSTPAGQIRPSTDVTAAAKTLKVGDEVSVSYRSYKGWITVTDLSTTAPRTAGMDVPFEFVRAEEITRSGEKFLGVTVKREKVVWTFVVPNEQVSAATLKGPDGEPLGEGTISAPAPRIVKCLSTLQTGDLVSLDYRPDGYLFVLASMKVSRVVETGKYEGMSAKMVDGKRHDTAGVRVDGKLHYLVVPLPNPQNPTMDEGTRLTTFLNNIRKYQSVDVVYRRHQGVSWLENIVIKP